MSSQPTTVRELIRSSVPFTWPECLALIQCIAATHEEAAVPATADVLQEFAIDDAGRVTLHGVAGIENVRLSVPDLAMLLGTLLPSEEEHGRAQAPAGIHFTIARALGLVEAPPFASVADFSRALARYEEADRAALLRQTVARYRSRTGVREFATAKIHDRVGAHLRRDERRGSGMQQDTLRRLLREADREAYDARRAGPNAGWDVRRHSPSPEMLRRFLREADQVHYELTRLAAARTEPRSVRRAMVAPIRRRIARVPAALLAMRLGRHRSRTLAGVGILLITAAAAAEREPLGDAWSFLTSPSRPATPLTQLAPVPQLPPSPTASLAGDSEKTPARVTGTSGRPAPLARDSSDSSAADFSGGDIAASAGLAPLPALPQPSGRLIQALDVAQRPVFSPAFAADRSALFSEGQAAGAVVAAGGANAADGQAAFVRVLSIASDRGHNYHPRLSPDSRTIAFDSDRDGVRGVYLASRDGRNVRRVSGSEYAAFPTWSPDGKHLAFVQSEPGQPMVWNVWSLEVESGKTARLTTYRYGQPWGVSWFPDNRRICFAHEDELVVLDTTSDETHYYASPRNDRLIRMPVVSPDGTRVLFQLDNDGAWLLELKDGSMREVLADPSAEDFAWAPGGNAIVFRTGGEWSTWSFE